MFTSYWKGVENNYPMSKYERKQIQTKHNVLAFQINYNVIDFSLLVYFLYISSRVKFLQ